MAKSYDLIIVGAGMVGTLSAILLAKSSLRIALVDKHNGEYRLSTPPAYDARVSAISSQSKALLEAANVWQGIARDRIASYDNMVVWDGLGEGHVDFNAGEAVMPELGHLVENAVLNQQLMEQARHAKNIDLYLGDTLDSHELSESGVRVELASGHALDAQVIIAADGALSKLRMENAFDTIEWDYGHHAIVTTIEIAQPHENTAWQSFGEEGILAFLPLPSVEQKHFVSIVWSVPPQEAESLMVLDEETFCRRLHYAMNKRFDVLGITQTRQSIPLRQRHAKQYVKAGLALIGDAAHTIHPLAGQGANLGFGDVKALVEVLEKAHGRGEHLGASKVLRRYQRARMLDNIAMAAGMESFKRLFSTQQPFIVQLRNIGMKRFNQNASLKKKLVAKAAGLS
ncbi:2-octaprenyl-6-methoxyphenol hydroxylase /2-octaprenyl-3-methyl-6-methoxy-1,4-benzoquinol hydroxylase [Marinomonas alcarazii]|uniref:2-octaprenyl-6-methoxyphenol hydroxylase /2-octaprenyl-3-methyl-6-methoxy-1,4-benzoquinol hydroxylase n=1 Tax=Marinomonas alcarazii TaxID=491949 RepID=A0A318UZ17_9GAMM|nr:UbiH/UbiF/VisC/COQ6 family ubiquinone biosynthesis hydroxylase [Marinomonas alcarazii]PYF79275.1 2-octaprenyl-6-methoxyphenol hydroxylase /2-octaprenyl-3-methyl-6-methoxy-1,4-benzoquinol hydroxylase [Marinomonas alcarazii]